MLDAQRNTGHNRIEPFKSSVDPFKPPLEEGQILLNRAFIATQLCTSDPCESKLTRNEP